MQSEFAVRADQDVRDGPATAVPRGRTEREACPLTHDSSRDRRRGRHHHRATGHVSARPGLHGVAPPARFLHAKLIGIGTCAFAWYGQRRATVKRTQPTPQPPSRIVARILVMRKPRAGARESSAGATRTRPQGAERPTRTAVQRRRRGSLRQLAETFSGASMRQGGGPATVCCSAPSVRDGVSDGDRIGYRSRDDAPGDRVTRLRISPFRAAAQAIHQVGDLVPRHRRPAGLRPAPCPGARPDTARAPPARHDHLVLHAFEAALTRPLAEIQVGHPLGHIPPARGGHGTSILDSPSFDARILASFCGPPTRCIVGNVPCPTAALRQKWRGRRTDATVNSGCTEFLEDQAEQAIRFRPRRRSGRRHGARRCDCGSPFSAR